MSVLNDGSNLPGVLVDIEQETTSDYDPSQFGSTESVLIIGTAFSGPTGTPVKIYNSDMGRYYFGDPYDAATHRYATLTNGIKAAYDAGCKTIYAMRVGGETIYKDFRLCEEGDNFRLRIASTYPTNTAKKSYIYVNVNSGEEAITLYKPASKATIKEKKTGAVDSLDSMLVSTVYLNDSNGLTRNDKLISLIDAFNDDEHNNIFHMSIVDSDGYDVTTTAEAQELCIGSLFNGVYCIGRDRNADGLAAYTTLKASAIINDTDSKPYTSYDKSFYRKIVFNSDITADYPIYAESYSELKEVLSAIGITTSRDYDFLKTPGMISRAWLEDEKDYEDVNLSNFDMYKALGSGFAVTAKAVRREDKNGKIRVPRVIESPADDDNHIVSIGNGIYSLLENLEVDYRVLVAKNADDKINAKLPKASEFKIAVPTSVQLLGADGADALIEATAIIDEKDFSADKSYKFHFRKVAEEDISSINVSDIYVEKIARLVAGFEYVAGKDPVETVKEKLGNSTVPSGTQFIVFDDADKKKAHLVRADENNLSIVNIAGLEGELLDVDNALYVGKLETNGITSVKELVFVPLMTETASVNGEDKQRLNHKTHVLIDSGYTIYVGSIDGLKDASAPIEVKITPLGSLTDVLEDDVMTLIYAENCYGKENNIIITTAAADFIPLDEFVDVLQNDDQLGRMFTFSLTDTGTDKKDMYPEEIEDDFADEHAGKRYFEQTLSNGQTVAGESYIMSKDKDINYDYTKYIPYRTNDNFVRQLAQHCAYSSLRTKQTHGIIGYTPLRSLTLKSIAERAEELRNSDLSSNLIAKKNNGRPMLGAKGQPYHIGANVSVTAFQHPVVDETNNYTIIVNGAAAYAGMISALPVEQSTTMQPITINDVGFSFSEGQLREVVNAGFVATKENSTKGTCIVDGVTMASSDELRRRLSISRTINAVGDAIRAAGEPYLGKKNNVNNRNSLKTAIDSALNELVDILIWNYTFEIVNLSTYTVDSKIEINYSIFPMNEIRNIDNSITIVRQSTSSTNQ